MKIRVNDNVFIRTGKDHGKTGVVTKIEGDHVTVEGINKAIKHRKGRSGQPGERVEFFAPLHVSNVALMDPKSGKPTRVGFLMEGNQKFRISKTSGERITGEAKKKAPKSKSQPKKK